MKNFNKEVNQNNVVEYVGNISSIRASGYDSGGDIQLRTGRLELLKCGNDLLSIEVIEVDGEGKARSSEVQLHREEALHLMFELNKLLEVF